MCTYVCKHACTFNEDVDASLHTEMRGRRVTADPAPDASAVAGLPRERLSRGGSEAPVPPSSALECIMLPLDSSDPLICLKDPASVSASRLRCALALGKRRGLSATCEAHACVYPIHFLWFSNRFYATYNIRQSTYAGARYPLDNV